MKRARNDLASKGVPGFQTPMPSDVRKVAPALRHSAIEQVIRSSKASHFDLCSARFLSRRFFAASDICLFFRTESRSVRAASTAFCAAMAELIALPALTSASSASFFAASKVLSSFMPSSFTFAEIDSRSCRQKSVCWLLLSRSRLCSCGVRLSELRDCLCQFWLCRDCCVRLIRLPEPCRIAV